MHTETSNPPLTSSEFSFQSVEFITDYSLMVQFASIRTRTSIAWGRGEKRVIFFSEPRLIVNEI